MSALCIVGYHYTTRYTEISGGKGFAISVPWGFMAVSVFFVLSAFLTAYGNTEKSTPIQFLIRRFSRLWPSFIVCASVTFLVTSFFLPSRGVTWTDFLGNMTMIPGMLGFELVDGAYWTLAYEIIFYILVSLILLAGLWKKRNKIFFVYVLMLFIAFFLNDYLPFMNKVNVLIMSDYGQMFAVGIALETLLTSVPADSKEKYLAVCTCLLSLGYTFLCRGMAYGIFMMVVVGMTIGAVKLHCIGGGSKRLIWTTRPLCFVSSISYPLYLLHQNIGYAILEELKKRGILSGVHVFGVIAVMMVAAYLIHQMIEVPIGKVLNCAYDKLKNVLREYRRKL